MPLSPARYTELFLAESRDNLAVVNDTLLQLERDPRDGAALDALFRAVHTVKGMAGVMGYTAVADLTHDMEALLAVVRRGARSLGAADAALLFEAADALEASIERSVAGQGAALDLTALRERLRASALGDEDPAQTLQTTAEHSATLPDEDGAAVHVWLSADVPLKGARAFLVLQRARELGTVLRVAPDEAALQAEAFGLDFAVRLRTEAPEADIVAALRTAGYVDRVTVRRSGDAMPRAKPPTAGERADAAWAAGALQAPLQRHVRIDQRRLDAMMNLVGELVIARGRLAQVAGTHADADLDEAAGTVSRLVSELQDGIMASRLVPVWQVFDRFPRVVRDAARALGKEIEFVLDGREIELDRALLEQVSDPLVHLLRNAVDHGIEPPEDRERAGKPRAGRLVLSATRERSAVVIRVTDDGRGIDRRAVWRRAVADGAVDADHGELADDEILRIIAQPGFSTAERVSALSGRGVGVDAVLTRVRALGGSMELRTAVAEGTTISIRLPVTLAIIPALLARAEHETYALPLTHVQETLQATPGSIRRVRGREVLVLREEVLPLFSLRAITGLPARDVEGSQIVVLGVAERRAGLAVDQLIGQQEIVVKPFDAVRGAPASFSGATILSDGAPALILEATSLF